MRFAEMIANNQEWINGTWEKLDEKLSRTSVKSRNKIPHTTRNGEHDDHSQGKNIVMWTNGFWGGLMWLMYAETGKDCYKQTAEISEKLLDQAFHYMEDWNHDVGFMWHILSGAHYKLTGDMDSRNRNLIAAMSLMSRYNVEGDYIRCWNSWITDEDVSGWTIIDCLMNLPLLYWASDELKDSRFKKVAIRYANMAIRDHLRSDGSVRHIVIHDTEKAGVVLGTNVGQAYSEDSSWARGTAWALYGFMLSYIHTKDMQYIEAAKRIANYFIECTRKTNWLPLLDFRQPETPVYYDSTSGAIAACGLIEIARHAGDEEKDFYLEAALNILKAMEENWCDWSVNEDGILLMGSHAYGKGIHTSIIYGDYFFTEAILKLKGSQFNPW